MGRKCDMCCSSREVVFLLYERTSQKGERQHDTLLQAHNGVTQLCPYRLPSQDVLYFTAELTERMTATQRGCLTLSFFPFASPAQSSPLLCFTGWFLFWISRLNWLTLEADNLDNQAVGSSEQDVVVTFTLCCLPSPLVLPPISNLRLQHPSSS